MGFKELSFYIGLDEQPKSYLNNPHTACKVKNNAAFVPLFRSWP